MAELEPELLALLTETERDVYEFACSSPDVHFGSAAIISWAVALAEARQQAERQRAEIADRAWEAINIRLADAQARASRAEAQVEHLQLRGGRREKRTMEGENGA